MASPRFQLQKIADQVSEALQALLGAPFDLHTQRRVHTATLQWQKAIRERPDVTNLQSHVTRIWEQGLRTHTENAINLIIEKCSELENVDEKSGNVRRFIYLRNIYLLRARLEDSRPGTDFSMNGTALREKSLKYAVAATKLSRTFQNLSMAGNLALRLEQHHVAAELLDEAAKLNGASVAILLDLVSSLLPLGRMGEAFNYAQRAFVLAPDLSIVRQLFENCASEIQMEKRLKPRSARWPRLTSQFADLKALAKQAVIGKDRPTPLLSANSTIMTMGSCFAQNLASAINQYNLLAHSFPFGEEVNSTHANRAVFERLAGAQNPEDDELGRMIRSSMLGENIRKSELFILTLGVSQAFFNRTTGKFLFQATEGPDFFRRIFLENDYRSISVAENVANIRYIIESLHTIRPDLKIVLTVSPVPLARTFAHESAIQSDCVSKSTLRVAADEIIQAKIPGVCYWPSFEMVRWMDGHMPQGSASAFGTEDGYARHVSRHLIELIVELFLETFGDETVVLKQNSTVSET